MNFYYMSPDGVCSIEENTVIRQNQSQDLNGLGHFKYVES